MGVSSVFSEKKFDEMRVRQAKDILDFCSLLFPTLMRLLITEQRTFAVYCYIIK